MPKQFIDPSAVRDGIIWLEGSAAHHYVQVLRIRPGEHIIVCDGASTDYHCTVKQTKRSPAALMLEVIHTCDSDTEPPTKVTLYQALPKGDKMDWVIQKSIELGVQTITPVITAHTAATLRDWKSSKSERFQKIAEAAAGQSMRGIIPQVTPPVALDTVLHNYPENRFMLAAYEQERTETIKSVFRDNMPKDIGLIIGPEGGFSDDEAQAMKESGVTSVSLGKRILRTETAGLAALAQIFCILEGE